MISSGVSGLAFLFRTASAYEVTGAAAESPCTGSAGAAVVSAGDEGEEAEAGAGEFLTLFLDLAGVFVDVATGFVPEPPTAGAEATRAGGENATEAEAAAVVAAVVVVEAEAAAVVTVTGAEPRAAASKATTRDSSPSELSAP